MNKGNIRVIVLGSDKSDTESIIQSISSIKALKAEIVYGLNLLFEKIIYDDYDCIIIVEEKNSKDTLKSVNSIRTHTTKMPIIIVACEYVESTGLKLIRSGAHDYLSETGLNEETLLTNIKFAIERHKVRAGIYNLAFVDELTGLYNRRGFMMFAQQQIALSGRRKKGFAILFADLDGMKKINDTYGHEAGDLALFNTAEILRKSFRRSDVIARMGGDEFAAIINDISDSFEYVLGKKLNEVILDFNAQAGLKFNISLSFGLLKVPFRSTMTLDQMLSKADKLMYNQKLEKKVNRNA